MRSFIKAPKANTAMGLILSTALIAGLASPGAAQDRRNRRAETPAPAAAPAAPAPSRAFITAYRPVNDAITAANWPVAEAGLPALVAASASAYERYLAAHAEFRMAAGQSDVPRQLRAADAMADSDGAPAAEAPRVWVAAGQLAYNAGDYVKAASRFARARTLGATTENLPLLLLDSTVRAGQLDQAVTLTRTMITEARTNGTRVPENVYTTVGRALQQADRTADLVDMMAARAEAYPTAANFSQAALIYLQSVPDSDATTIDVMRLLSDAGALTTRPLVLEYVTAAADRAFPNESAAVIRRAREQGIIQASDTTFNEIYDTQNGKLAEDRTSLAAMVRRAPTVTNAQQLTVTGDALLGYGDNAQALAMYQLALAQAGVDANVVNTHIGIAQARTGAFGSALAAFGRVTGERAPMARLWSAWVNTRIAAAVPNPAPAAPAVPAPATPAG